MLLQSDVFVKNFLKLPERTRLFRLFKTHRDWTDCFLAQLPCWDSGQLQC